jgi:two-component system phosphate regulon response regulator PhoB
MTSDRMKPSILIVEDEPPLVELIRYNLECEGFRARIAPDGEEALAMIADEAPDLVILDWMLPKMSGLDICRQIRRRRKTRDTPIIMLTARSEEADRVRGLDSGADDYVTKPFSPKELVARINAVLRRTRPSFGEEKIAAGGVVMDLAAHRVTRDGMPIVLGPTEYRLLHVLLERPRRVFSREQLLDRVWGRDIYVEARTVDVHVLRLRKALNADGRPDLVRTVRGAGYAFEAETGASRGGD